MTVLAYIILSIDTVADTAYPITNSKPYCFPTVPYNPGQKHARDVYTYLADKYGTSIFVNIAVSEQNHMDAVM